MTDFTSRIYINREAIEKNREARAVVRTDVITVAHVDPSAPDVPTDTRQGCDRGAVSYAAGMRVDLLDQNGDIVASVIHDPNMLHGASVWVETSSLQTSVHVS